MNRFINDESGSTGGEFMIIAGMIVYFTFMGYLGNALGYTSPQIGAIGSWSIPYVDMPGGWLEVFTGTLDVLIALLNILAWILQALVSYAVLIGYSMSGGVPPWVLAFLFTPIAFGLGWLVLSMARGRGTG